MTTNTQGNHEATLKQSAIHKRSCGEGVLVFMGRGGEKQKERYMVGSPPRQSGICGIL